MREDARYCLCGELMPQPASQATLVQLRDDNAYLTERVKELQRQLDTQVSYERDNLMRDATRRYKAGRMTRTWVIATHRLITADHEDVAHHHDPLTPPRTVTPTTVRRPRYLNGDIRDAGPGSHIGVALCGRPLMADELWCRADHLIRGPASNANSFLTLCGMCSYLSGQPTLSDAWEVLRDA